MTYWNIFLFFPENKSWHFIQFSWNFKYHFLGKIRKFVINFVPWWLAQWDVMVKQKHILTYQVQLKSENWEWQKITAKTESLSQIPNSKVCKKTSATTNKSLFKLTPTFYTWNWQHADLTLSFRLIKAILNYGSPNSKHNTQIPTEVHLKITVNF